MCCPVTLSYNKQLDKQKEFKLSRKTWIIFIVVVFIIFASIIFIANRGKIDVSSLDPNKIMPASADSGDIADHVLGNKDSKVVMIEYGDFQCPTCSTVAENIKIVTERHKDQLAFVFRNFPITSIHPNALAASATAEAAGLQGKYWEMNDKIFTSQNTWTNLSAIDRTSYFNELARGLGLNLESFTNDISSERVSQKIAFDQALAKKVGVSGTPTVYINGEIIPLDKLTDEAKLETVISEAIEKYK